MKHPISRSFFRDAGLCLVVAYVALLPQFYLVYEKGNRFSLDWSPTVRASILISIALLAAAYGILYAGARLVGGLVDRRLRRAAIRPAIDLLALWIMTAVALRSAMAIIYATRPATDAVARYEKAVFGDKYLVSKLSVSDNALGWNRVNLSPLILFIGILLLAPFKTKGVCPLRGNTTQ